MNGSTLKAIALIPARAGSERIPEKNIRPLAGHPLLAYSIAAARDSGIFESVIVSTDNEYYADIARHYAAEVPFLRPVEIAGPTSPDIEWVDFTLRTLNSQGHHFDCFSILRPTSPFRATHTIQRAWKEFINEPNIDSLRAVEPCKQHPGKMWLVNGKRMRPFLSDDTHSTPWHSSQYADLPLVHVQNASLEIAWSRTVLDSGSISGDVVMPFFTERLEGVDINTPEDWWYAEHLLKKRHINLPAVTIPPWPAVHQGEK